MSELNQATRDHQARCCKRLWGAVLLQAIKEATDPDTSKLMDQSRAWLLLKGTGADEVCEKLGARLSKLQSEVRGIIADVRSGALSHTTWARYMSEKYMQWEDDPESAFYAGP